MRSCEQKNNLQGKEIGGGERNGIHDHWRDTASATCNQEARDETVRAKICFCKSSFKTKTSFRKMSTVSNP